MSQAVTSTHPASTSEWRAFEKGVGRGGRAQNAGRMNVSAPLPGRTDRDGVLAVRRGYSGDRGLPAPAPIGAAACDLPPSVVTARPAGADPATMASSVAEPLERRLGTIAAVTEMTSDLSLGTNSIVRAFDLSRSVEVWRGSPGGDQNAAGKRTGQAVLPNPPYIPKANRATHGASSGDGPSDRLTPSQIYDCGR